MVKSYKIFVPLVLLFLMSNLSLAQDDFREKIEEVKLEKLTKKLELDDNTKENFIEKYKSFSKTMRTLNVKRVKTYKLMTENIESGNGLDTIVNQLIDNENEINQKRVDFVNDMKSILTSPQIAKMIVFERKFNNEIKKLLKQYQKDNKNENPFKED
jgi:hypothetical protein